MASKNKINAYRSILCFTALLLIFVGSASGQDLPATSKGELTFYLDHAAFSGEGQNQYVEFYLMFYLDQLTRHAEEEKEFCSVELEAQIFDSENRLLRNRKWITDVNIEPKDSNLFLKVAYDQWSELLAPGSYSLIVNAKDALGNTRGRISKQVAVPEINSGTLSGSEIEFVSSASVESGQSHFNKGKFRLFPNPHRRYGVFNTQMYFYYEIYGLDDVQDFLRVDYKITDHLNKEVKKIVNIKIPIPGNSVSVVHGIDVKELQSGIYNLEANITDEKDQGSCSLSRKFEIIQLDFFDPPNNISEEQDAIFQTLLSYLGNPNELNRYKKLNDTGKTEFIVQYWKNSDTDLSTPENEYLIEIQKRFNHARDHFRWHNVNGWETDRGRICIKYGIPHQVNQYSNEAGTAPYEIWVYNESRIFEFIFGDLRSNGRYILIHSNKEGEIFNINWPELIQRM